MNEPEPTISSSAPDAAEVVERARRTMEERRMADAVRAASRQRLTIVLVALCPALLLGALVFWPDGTLAERLQHVVRGICDQQHNLTSFGGLLPFDARCTGIYAGALASWLCLGLRRRLGANILPLRSVLVVGLLAILFIAVDGINSWLAEINAGHLYAPHNALRLASGLGAGTTLALLGTPIVNSVVRERGKVREVVCTPREALGIAAVVMLLGTVLWWGGPRWLGAMLGVFTVMGAFAVLVVSHLFGLVLVARQQRQVVLAAQLARPAVLAMGIVVLEFVVLGMLRDA